MQTTTTKTATTGARCADCGYPESQHGNPKLHLPCGGFLPEIAAEHDAGLRDERPLHTNDCIRQRAKFGARSAAGDVCSCGADTDDGLEMHDNSCGECGHPYKPGDETHYPECSRLITFDVHAYKTQDDYDQCRPTKIIDGIIGCDDANKEARKWLVDHAVVKVQSSDREMIDVLRNEQPSDPAELSEHTPTPWMYSKGNTYFKKLDKTLTADLIYEKDFGGRWIAAVFQDEFTVEEQEANGEFIVRCVNSHASLVAALEQAHELLYVGVSDRKMLSQSNLYRVVDIVSATLKQARGGE